MKVGDTVRIKSKYGEYVGTVIYTVGNYYTVRFHHGEYCIDGHFHRRELAPF